MKRVAGVAVLVLLLSSALGVSSGMAQASSVPSHRLAVHKYAVSAPSGIVGVLRAVSDVVFQPVQVTYAYTAPTAPTAIPGQDINSVLDSVAGTYRAEANNLAGDDVPYVTAASITMTMLLFVVRGFNMALGGRLSGGRGGKRRRGRR